jgi:hypothetical protein
MVPFSRTTILGLALSIVLKLWRHASIKVKVRPYFFLPISSTAEFVIPITLYPLALLLV